MIVFFTDFPPELKQKILIRLLPGKKICDSQNWHKGVKALFTLRRVCCFFKEYIETFKVAEELKLFWSYTNHLPLAQRLNFSLGNQFQTRFPFYWVMSEIHKICFVKSFSLSSSELSRDINYYLKNPASFNEFDESALSAAILAGKLEEVKLLVRYGASVNLPSNMIPGRPIPCRYYEGCEFVANPLSLAIQQNHFPIVQFLVESGASVRDGRVVNNELNTPVKYLYSSFDYAIRVLDGRVQCVELLIKKDASFFTQNSHQPTDFHGPVFSLVASKPRYVAFILAWSPYFATDFSDPQLQHQRVMLEGSLGEKVKKVLELYERMHDLAVSSKQKDFYDLSEKLIKDILLEAPQKIEIPFILNKFFTSLKDTALWSLPMTLKNKYLDRIHECAGLMNLTFLEDAILILRRIAQHLSKECPFTESELAGYKATCLAKEKRWTEALACAVENLETDPTNCESQRVQIVSLYNLHKLELARYTCNSALSRNPGSSQLQDLKAFLLLEEGNLDEARVILDQVLSKGGSIDSYLNKARICLIQGELPAAQALLKRAERMQPFHPLLISARGELHEYLGESQAADKDFKWAMQLAPDQLYLKTLLFRQALKYKDFKTAVSILEFFRKNQLEECFIFREAEARFLIMNEEFVKARKRVTQLLKEYPDHPRVRNVHALLALETKNYESAHNDLKIVLEQYPMQPEALELMKQVLFKLERHPEALPILNRLLQINPNDSESMILKTRILFGMKDFSAVVSYLDECIERDSDHFLNYTDLIPIRYRSLLALGRFTQVVDEATSLQGCFENFEEVAPLIAMKAEAFLLSGQMWALFNFANQLYDDRKLKEAEIAIDYLLKEEKYNPQFWTLKADICYELQEYEAGLSAVEQALSLDPKFEMALITRLSLLQELGKNQEIVQLTQNLKSENADTQSVFLTFRIHSLLALNQYVELADLAQELYFDGCLKLALKILKGLIRKKYTPFEVWELKASISLELQKFNEALEAAQQAQSIKPQDLRVLNVLGWAYFELGELQLAQDVADRALQISPNALTFLSLKASICEQLGLDDQSIEYAKRVLSEEPDNLHILYTIVGAYQNSDQCEEALKVAKQILAINPDDHVGLEYKKLAEWGIQRLKDKKRKKMDSE